jgi:hypothetical protein
MYFIQKVSRKLSLLLHWSELGTTLSQRDWERQYLAKKKKKKVFAQTIHDPSTGPGHFATWSSLRPLPMKGVYEGPLLGGQLTVPRIF